MGVSLFLGWLFLGGFFLGIEMVRRVWADEFDGGLAGEFDFAF